MFKKTKCKKPDDTGLFLIQTLDKHLSNQTGPQNEMASNDDPHKLFCLSLVKVLKELKPRKNALAKIEIQQVLFETQFPK